MLVRRKRQTCRSPKKKKNKIAMSQGQGKRMVVRGTSWGLCVSKRVWRYRSGKGSCGNVAARETVRQIKLCRRAARSRRQLTGACRMHVSLSRQWRTVSCASGTRIRVATRSHPLHAYTSSWSVRNCTAALYQAVPCALWTRTQHCDTWWEVSAQWQQRSY